MVTGRSLGARITDCENKAFWPGLFEDLKEHGYNRLPTSHLGWAYGHPEGSRNCFPWRILADTSGPLYQAVLRNVPRRDQKEACGNDQNLKKVADDLNAQGYRNAANTIARFLPGHISHTAFLKRHPEGSER
jgi:putative transposase